VSAKFQLSLRSYTYHAPAQILLDHNRYLLVRLLPTAHPSKWHRLQRGCFAVPSRPALRAVSDFDVRNFLVWRQVQDSGSDIDIQFRDFYHRTAHYGLLVKQCGPIFRRFHRHRWIQCQRSRDYGLPGQQHSRPVEASFLQRHFDWSRRCWRHCWQSCFSLSGRSRICARIHCGHCVSVRSR
jgi:hypothetical protein